MAPPCFCGMWFKRTWLVHVRVSASPSQLPGGGAETAAGAGEVWAFPGARDKSRHRTRQAVWADMRRAAKAFRFRRVVSPHSARKFYAVQLMRKYHDVARVQRILAHDNPAVTMLYALADVVPDNRL